MHFETGDAVALGPDDRYLGENLPALRNNAERESGSAHLTAVDDRAGRGRRETRSLGNGQRRLVDRRRRGPAVPKYKSRDDQAAAERTTAASAAATFTSA